MSDLAPSRIALPIWPVTDDDGWAHWAVSDWLQTAHARTLTCQKNRARTEQREGD